MLVSKETSNPRWLKSNLQQTLTLLELQMRANIFMEISFKAKKYENLPLKCVSSTAFLSNVTLPSNYETPLLLELESVRLHKTHMLTIVIFLIYNTAT